MDDSKQMPGERCNWLTTTRSAPLMTNVPCGVMSGISPMYTFSSFVPFSSLSRKVTWSGALNVWLSRCASSAVSFGSPIS